MAYSIIDTPQPVFRYLPKLGSIETIIRYITSRSPHSDKHIQPKEARAIQVAGKKLGIVHEVWGDYKHAGHGGISAADGHYDGPYAVQALKNLGAPTGAACYFAVDTDGTTSQLTKNAVPYFAAVHEAFDGSGFRVGVYGPGSLCKKLKEEGLADLFWLANAKGWSGYKAFLGQEDLLQHIPTHIAGGLDVDPNTTDKEDWGQFEPFSVDHSPEPMEEPRRFGQGDGTDKPQDPDEKDDLGVVDQTKTLFKSKIAWLTSMLGGGAATTSIASDYQVQSALGQLVKSPGFLIAVTFIAIAGFVIYYRWRDHGRGQQ